MRRPLTVCTSQTDRSCSERETTKLLAIFVGDLWRDADQHRWRAIFVVDAPQPRSVAPAASPLLLQGQCGRREAVGGLVVMHATWTSSKSPLIGYMERRMMWTRLVPIQNK